MSLVSMAANAARRFVEKQYDGVCTIMELNKKELPTYETVSTWESVAIGVACRLSFRHSPMADDSNTADTKAQEIILFLTPEVSVKPGSRIEVTQCGVTKIYENAGQPKVYYTHQEIALKMVEELV